MSPAPKFVACLPNPLVIEIVGGDASKVINNMCTNDVAKLPVDASTETFITDARGWVVAHVGVFKLSDRAWLLGSHAASSAVVKHIDRYIIREDAVVHDRSHAHALIVIGDGPESASEQSDNEDEPGIAVGGVIAGVSRFESSEDMKVGCQLPIFGLGTQLVCCPLDQAGAIVEVLCKGGAELCSVEQFDWLRISSFWPLHPFDISEKTIPQELDRDSHAISFTKGCYLGQETIARLDARGQLQKKLCLVELTTAGNYAIGDFLSNGEKEVGQITSLATEPKSERVRALATLRRGNFSAGTELVCNGFPAHVLR